MPATTTCPTCGKKAQQEDNKAYPFCTQRCQLIDLGRWLGEEYRLPEGAGDASGGGAEGVPAAGEDREPRR